MCFPTCLPAIPITTLHTPIPSPIPTNTTKRSRRVRPCLYIRIPINLWRKTRLIKKIGQGLSCRQQLANIRGRLVPLSWIYPKNVSCTASTPSLPCWGDTFRLGDIDLNGVVVVLFEFEEMPCYSGLLGC